MLDPAPQPHLDLPLITFDEVFHVGSLNTADRKSASYEGDGLSVSVHPDDWSHIARLGGTATWAMRRTDATPLRFVAFHDLSEAATNTIREWGQTHGWIAQREVYRISWHDDEYDDTMSMEFDTRAEAQDEADFRADEDETDVPLTTIMGWRPTPTFPDTRISRDYDPTDVLIATYIRQHLPEVDGLWWDDDYAPERLSCPRGVLVHNLDRYTINRT